MIDDEGSTILRRSPAAPSRRAFRLVVEAGPSAPSRQPIPTSYLRTLVGQSAACTIQIADRQVSRRHFALEPTDTGLAIVDLDSTNGTFVDGVRIASAFLRGGERIAIGDSVLLLEEVEPTGTTAPPPARTRFGNLVGASPQMRELYTLCGRVAASDLPVLIEGETGTGKEVLAEALHVESARKDGPFIVFDCTAVPPNLAESELFGHERGAFTGAVATRRGVFEQAHGGTLFIDEIGDLDAALQPKLLRALERGEVRRVGGDRWIKVDVRIVSATRRDIDHEVQAGRFRDDLFFRLAVARLELPPLRARTGDVEVLLAHFWSTLGGSGAVPYDVARRFERHGWPGNVRELRNAVARQVALGESFSISTPPKAAEPARDPVAAILELDLPYPRARDLALAEFEDRYLDRVLRLHDGNVARAAEASGIARRYFNILLARRKK